MTPPIDPRISAEFAYNYPDMPLERHLSCLAYVGSVSHGMFIPPEDPMATDDIDLMGVVCPPVRRMIGLNGFETWVMKRDELDVTLRSLEKTVRLLLQANPNALCLLWLRPQDYLILDPIFQLVVENRKAFSSRLFHKALVGYSRNQVDQMDKGKYRGYMGIKRKALVDRFGFDPKAGAHAVRLLRMGVEFIKTGEMKVFREDAAELISIKRGERSKQRIVDECRSLIKEADEALKTSPLPAFPRKDVAEQLLLTCTFASWGIERKDVIRILRGPAAVST